MIEEYSRKYWYIYVNEDKERFVEHIGSLPDGSICSSILDYGLDTRLHCLMNLSDRELLIIKLSFNVDTIAPNLNVDTIAPKDLIKIMQRPNPF